MFTAIDNQTVITLKGSVSIVKEFFFTAINSILYQRGKVQRSYFETFRNGITHICRLTNFRSLQESTSPRRFSARRSMV